MKFIPLQKISMFTVVCCVDISYNWKMLYFSLVEFPQGVEAPVLVFVQSKERAKELYQELVYDGMNVDIIHSDRSQEEVGKVLYYYIYMFTSVITSISGILESLNFDWVTLDLLSLLIKQISFENL